MSKKFLVKNRETIVPELTREIPENGIFSIGNDSSATLELKDERVAPEQFVIVCEGSQVTLDVPRRRRANQRSKLAARLAP